MTVAAMICLLIFLQVADVLSTIYAFRNGAVEANPIMSWFIKHLGVVPGLILPKLFYCGLLFYYVGVMMVVPPAIAIIAVSLFYGFIIHNNIRLGRKR